MDTHIDASENPRRIQRTRRPRHHFKPSFLRPDPSSSLQLPAPRQFLTRPAYVPAPNLVPWMDAYNRESRQVVVHQGTLRAKARNQPPALSPLRHLPVLETGKSVPLMKRSYSQAVLQLEKGSAKEVVRDKEEMRLLVRGSASMQARRELELEDNVAQHVVISPVITAVERRRKQSPRPFLSDSAGFKYFNATVIPVRESHKVTVEDVRKYITYMESRHFR